MKKISRHAIDPELVREGVESYCELVEHGVKSAAGRASALSVVLGTARSYAGYVAAANEEMAEIYRAMRIDAQAAAAIFALGSGVGEIEFALGDRHMRLAATGPTDATHVGNWRVGLWLAHIVRDRAAIDTLVATPIDVLRRSGSRGDECHYLFIDALQAFEKRMPDWLGRLHAALDATDPERVRMFDEEFVLNILVPEMQMLFRLAIGEVAPFNEALLFALDRHKNYWNNHDRGRDPDGYLALGSLAIASLAYDSGRPLDVESDYAPRGLIAAQGLE